MSINVADNFSYQGSKPLDARFQFATVAAMKAYAEASLYNGCLAYITGTKEYYTYDSSNTVDSTTGRWRIFESGSGGASALSDLTDTTINNPSSGQILKYSGTSWVNSTNSAAEINDNTITATTAWSSSKVYSELGNKQPKTLDTPITIDGTQYTTVEDALSALNMGSGAITYTDVTDKVGVNHFTFNSADLADRGQCKIFVCKITDFYGETNLPHDSSTPDTGKLYIVKMIRTKSTTSDWFSQECYEIGIVQSYLRVYARYCYTSSGIWQFNSWSEIGSSGVDTSKLYSTDDTAESSLADNDYLPFQDTSASGKRKTLWGNIKSVLKSYFDPYYKLVAGTNIGLTDDTNNRIISATNTISLNYSTSEQAIGTWINGKTLFQRTYTGTLPNATGSGTSQKVSGTIFSFAYDIVNFSSIMYLTGGSRAEGNSNEGIIYYSSGAVGVSYPGSAYAQATYYITLQYTKS